MNKKIASIILFLLPVYLTFGQNKSYSLQECVDIAIKNNLTVKSAQLQVLTDDENIKLAKASRLPSLGLSGTQSINVGRSVNPFDNTVVENQTVRSNSFSLGTNLNIFNGLETFYTIQRNMANKSASELDVKNSENNVILATVEAYAAVAQGKEQIIASRKQVDNLKLQQQQTAKMVAAGAMAQVNLFDMDAQLAQEETNLVTAENQLDLAKIRLLQAMQITDFQDIEITGMLVKEEWMMQLIPEPAQVYEAAEKSLPQIKASMQRIEAAYKGIRIAESNYYPTLNLQGGIFTNYSSIAQRFVPGRPLETPVLAPIPGLVFSDPSLSAFQVVTNMPGRTESLNFNEQLSNNIRQGVTLNLNIPIYSNRQVKTNVNTAKINKLSAEISMRSVKNTVRQDIETAVTSAKLAQRRYQALLNQIKAQQELFRSAEQRFQVGAMNALDFNVITNNLSRLQTELIRQKYEVLLRNKVIDFYMGRDLTF